jgi:hypothetical protein
VNDLDQKAREGTQVYDMLAALSRINKERGALYGYDYLHLGEAMVGFFPNGLELRTAEDFNRFALFVHLGTKLNRYAQQIKKGGHVDSLDDLSVYAQLLQQFDSLARARPVGGGIHSPAAPQVPRPEPASRFVGTIVIDGYEHQGDGGPDSPQAPYCVTVTRRGQAKREEAWLHVESAVADIVAEALGLEEPMP